MVNKNKKNNNNYTCNYIFVQHSVSPTKANLKQTNLI